MTIDQLTDLAYEVTDELEPRFSFDVFDVSESEIIFQSERGLRKISLSCMDGVALKKKIKAELNTPR